MVRQQSRESPGDIVQARQGFVIQPIQRMGEAGVCWRGVCGWVLWVLCCGDPTVPKQRKPLAHKAGDKPHVGLRQHPFVSSMIRIERVLCQVTPAMPTWGSSPEQTHFARPWCARGPPSRLRGAGPGRRARAGWLGRHTESVGGRHLRERATFLRTDAGRNAFHPLPMRLPGYSS